MRKSKGLVMTATKGPGVLTAFTWCGVGRQWVVLILRGDQKPLHRVHSALVAPSLVFTSSKVLSHMGHLSQWQKDRILGKSFYLSPTASKSHHLSEPQFSLACNGNDILPTSQRGYASEWAHAESVKKNKGQRWIIAVVMMMIWFFFSIIL